MKIAIVTLTKHGKETGQKILKLFRENKVVLFVSDKFANAKTKKISGPFNEFVKTLFQKYEAIVFVMALGIVVRAIS